MNTRKTNNKGQAVVEMALVLPIFIVLLIGIIDFGRALHFWSNLNYQCVKAARAATKRIHPLIARNAFTSTTHASLDDVKDAFWEFKSPLMLQDDYSNVTYSGVGTSEKTVRVSASYKMQMYTPIVGVLISGDTKNSDLTLSAVAEERKE